MHGWLKADNNLQERKEKQSEYGLAIQAQHLPNIGECSDQPHGEVKRVHNSGITFQKR
jgi:hypothetical protein